LTEPVEAKLVGFDRSARAAPANPPPDFPLIIRPNTHQFNLTFGLFSSARPLGMLRPTHQTTINRYHQMEA
jgi:hypothetical protein